MSITLERVLIIRIGKGNCSNVNFRAIKPFLMHFSYLDCKKEIDFFR